MSNGLRVLRKDTPIETVQMKGLEFSLHATDHGTEIIHHRLQKGTLWSLAPVEGWTGLEYMYVLTGQLNYKHPDGDIALYPGDSVSAVPVETSAYFSAVTDTEFLYVTSQPVFHTYSQKIKQMMDLAVEIENKDGNTADHCSRIERMSLILGNVMNLSSAQLHTLKYAAFFHDIGKIRIPDHILNKPSSLTPDEWGTMKLHTIYGRQILAETRISSLVKASVIVEQHHERYDGQGYPHGLKGKEIDLLASIVSVVDSFDA
ncbi:MAG: HD-GYP domain-containing protein, partial [Tumebacillaceae bacterium]